ncbi:MAG: M12 family metallo-peptidase [Bacillota bacterium]
MLRLKGLLSVLMVLALLFVMPTAFAAPATTVTTLTYEDKADVTTVTNEDKADNNLEGELCTGCNTNPLKEDTKINTQKLEVIPDESDQITAALTIYTCWVKAACDDEWRAFYGTSWLTAANNAVEIADDNLYTQFGINLYVWTYYAWDTYDGSTDLLSLYNELKREVLPADGDTVYGYTKQKVNGTVFGLSQTYGKYVIVRRDQGNDTMNWQITRHETGHIYGCSDCSSTCIMKSPFAYPETWCSNHWNTMWNNRTMY